MTLKHKDGIDAVGAKPGDTVRCIGQRDDSGFPYFMKGKTYKVGVAPNGDPCIWTTGGKDGRYVLPFRGYGFFFEMAESGS